MDIHKVIEQQFDWIEFKELRDILIKKSNIITSQSLFLRAFLIKALATYTSLRIKQFQNTDSQYTARIKGICMTVLYICEAFGYINSEQVKNYNKILSI